MSNPLKILKWEKELKQARDQEIKKLRAEGKNDEEILERLMDMPATKQFTERACSLLPKQLSYHVAAETRIKLEAAFKKTLEKDGGHK